MITRMIRADLRRGRGVTAMLVALMALSALLASTGVAVVVTLTGAVNALATTASRPAYPSRTWRRSAPTDSNGSFPRCARTSPWR